VTDPPGYAVDSLPELTPDRVLLHFERLTFPPIARRLSVRPGSRRWLGAAALEPGGPVGLLVAALPDAADGGGGGAEIEGATEAGSGAGAGAAQPAPGVVEVLSFLVLPRHRGRGLGTALLARVEELAAEAGATAIQGAYRTSWRSRAAIEALLASRGWTPPQTRVLLARSSTASARPLVERQAPPLPPEAEVAAWEDLTDADHAAMAAICAEAGFPRQLSPYQDPDRLEAGISTVLRWEGRAAGWLTVHRISFDTVQYSALYLHPRVRGQKLYWVLLREAARRRLADPDLQGAIFAIAPDNRVMRGVIDGPMRRHFVQRSELRVSRKEL
jgi:GNAT superfamily N-acetyltransferase